MIDLDAQVAALKKRASDAQARRAKAQAQAAVARDRLTQAEGALRSEFGISPTEVDKHIAACEADLAAEVRRVQEALERAEASE
jgi:multidrug efflux pump subunit AcrA (membrane-fusion protein)